MAPAKALMQSGAGRLLPPLINKSLAAPAPDGQGVGTHSYLWRQVFFADPIGQWVCTRGHSFRWAIRRWSRNAEERRA
jgi:hypothetical protein